MRAVLLEVFVWPENFVFLGVIWKQINASQPSLSNLQIELLKVFSRNLSDEDVLEIRRMLTRYFAEKTIQEANKVWDEKGWTAEDAERMLNEHMRTPYHRPNSKTKH